MKKVIGLLELETYGPCLSPESIVEAAQSKESVTLGYLLDTGRVSNEDKLWVLTRPGLVLSTGEIKCVLRKVFPNCSDESILKAVREFSTGYFAMGIHACAAPERVEDLSQIYTDFVTAMKELFL